jgi:amino acid transporter
VSTTLEPEQGRPAFVRVLGRADLFFFSVSAILTIETLASAASMGPSWFSWWAIVVLAFFVPYGLITAELGSAWPGEGGLFLWVREAFGPRWGSLAAWFYWINNAYWIPSVYLVFASTFRSIFLTGRLPAELDRPSLVTWLEAAIALALTWLTVWIGVIRLHVSKWIPTFGAIVKLLIFGTLGGLGIAAVLLGRRPANALTWGALLPRLSDSLAFLPVLLYNALGFELMSSAGDEMKHPQRDVPRAIVTSGVVIGAVYALAVFGILWAVPLSKLSLVTGTWDALAVLGREWGAAGDALVLVLGVGFLYACVANVVTWALGANRVAAAAAAAGALPEPLGRLHPRHHTPHVAFAAMGGVASVLLVGNALLGSGSSNVFWMLFKLSGLCFLFTYLLVFPAFYRLRALRPGQPRPYRLPGGDAVALVAAALCFAFIAGACVLFFRPSPDADPARAVRETLLLGGECLATLVVGLWLLPRASGGPTR